MSQDPVLVVLVTKNCKFCDELLKIWDQLIQALLSVYPNLQFPTTSIETKQYQYPPIYINKNTIIFKIFYQM